MMLEKKIAAIIVLYFPKEDSLVKLLSSIEGQTNITYIIDNTNKCDDYFLNKDWLVKFGGDINYLKMVNNIGLAGAQNIGIKEALDHVCTHVIFFDQDSEASENMILSLAQEENALLESGKKVGAIGPCFYDIKTKKYAPSIRYKSFWIERIQLNTKLKKTILTDFIISSGTLVRLSVLKDIGLMEDGLFIDWVDIEWCFRLRKKYSLYVTSKTYMKHNVGTHYVNIGVKEVVLYDDIRYYYTIRNSIYLLIYGEMGFQWSSNIITKTPLFCIIFIINAKNKIFVTKLIGKAIVHGLMGKLGELIK